MGITRCALLLMLSSAIFVFNGCSSSPGGAGNGGSGGAALPCMSLLEVIMYRPPEGMTPAHGITAL